MFSSCVRRVLCKKQNIEVVRNIVANHLSDLNKVTIFRSPIQGCSTILPSRSFKSKTVNERSGSTGLNSTPKSRNDANKERDAIEKSSESEYDDDPLGLAECQEDANGYNNNYDTTRQQQNRTVFLAGLVLSIAAVLYFFAEE